VAAEKFIALNSELYTYLVAHGHNDDPILAELAEETARLGPLSAMQVSPEEGTFIGLLVRAVGAREALEIGTFTGYSALCIARALPADGRLLCCEINQSWADIARRFWDRAGVAHKIELVVRPALETLGALPAERRFDFVFIDADKTNYRAYYEEALRRARTGALILIDNVLWGGSVIDPSAQNDETRAIRDLNDFIAGDRRVEAVMLPVADGITVARKK
jgi:caffeoyl-CoA O-methyltransferase